MGHKAERSRRKSFAFLPGMVELQKISPRLWMEVGSVGRKSRNQLGVGSNFGQTWFKIDKRDWKLRNFEMTKKEVPGSESALLLLESKCCNQFDKLVVLSLPVIAISLRLFNECTCCSKSALASRKLEISLSAHLINKLVIMLTKSFALFINSQAKLWVYEKCFREEIVFILFFLPNNQHCTFFREFGNEMVLLSKNNNMRVRKGSLMQFSCRLTVFACKIALLFKIVSRKS